MHVLVMSWNGLAMVSQDVFRVHYLRHLKSHLLNAAGRVPAVRALIAY
jgi:hypothetical protein